MPNPFINHCNKFISQAKASPICDIIGSDCGQEIFIFCQTCKNKTEDFKMKLTLHEIAKIVGSKNDVAAYEDVAINQI